jgi:hypothetical protein
VAQSVRNFAPRRRHFSAADTTCKCPISRSRASRAGVIKGDANAADRHTAAGATGRSAGLQFPVGVPASAFFEFTGKKYPKAKHRFALKGSPITAIAGISREGRGNQPPSFTMLTTTPGPHVAPYHNRQVMVLPPGTVEGLLWSS